MAKTHFVVHKSQAALSLLIARSCQFSGVASCIGASSSDSGDTYSVFNSYLRLLFSLQMRTVNEEFETVNQESETVEKTPVMLVLKLVIMLRFALLKLSKLVLVLQAVVVMLI